MAHLPDPQEFRTPAYRYYLHSTLFNKNINTAYLDADYNTEFMGWMELPVGLYTKFSGDHIDNLTVKEMVDNVQMSAELWEQDIDVFKYDAVMYTLDDVYVDTVSPDNQISNADGCYLLVSIDTNGYTTSDTVGNVTIVGTNADDESINDPITISGRGTYVSNLMFKTVTSITSNNMSGCAITVWGDVGEPFRRRETRIYVDTFDSGHYGLIYGGFTTVSVKSVKYDDLLYSIDGVGYDDHQKNNEYVAGFRSMSRCDNYSDTGQFGACSASSVNWQVSGKCFVGDFNTYHPCGTVQCLSAYRCTDFVETSKYLPYDGYTYDTEYSDPEGADSDYYSPYPPDYFRFGLAIEKMCRSYEHDTVYSLPTTLYMVGKATLAEDITDAEMLLDIENFEGDKSLVSNELYAVIEDSNYNREIIFLVGGVTIDAYGAGSIGCARGTLKTEAQAFVTGDNVYFYEAALVANNMASTKDMLIEGNISSTIWATMESISNSLTERTVNSSWVLWVDKYRQIHINEMYGDNTGHSSDFTLTIDDIADVFDVGKSGVTNSVSANITLDDGTRFYPTLNVEDTDIDTTGESVVKYGRQWEEISNKQLNAVGETDLDSGYIGFKTYAYNYLKIHAFPTHSQAVVINGTFIPDEYNWSEFSSRDPLIEYTDKIREHVDLRTTRINCPDFNLKDRSTQEFVIEGLKYRATEYGTITTTIYMSRIASE